MGPLWAGPDRVGFVWLDPLEEGGLELFTPQSSSLVAAVRGVGSRVLGFVSWMFAARVVEAGAAPTRREMGTAVGDALTGCPWPAY